MFYSATAANCCARDRALVTRGDAGGRESEIDAREDYREARFALGRMLLFLYGTGSAPLSGGGEYELTTGGLLPIRSRAVA